MRLATHFFALAGLLVMVAAWGQTVSPAAPAAAVAPTVRAEITPPLKAAQDALGARRYDDALAQLKLADAVPDKTPYEVSLLERMRFIAAVGLEDWTLALQAGEATLATDQLDPALRGSLMDQTGTVAYRLKDYERAAKWAGLAIEAGAGNTSSRLRHAQSLYLMGRHPEAAQALEALVALQDKTGERPAESQWRLQASNLLKMNDEAGYARVLEALIALQPKPDLWADRLARLTRQPGFDSRLRIDVLRLGKRAQAWDQPGVIMELAERAMQAGFPHEALAAVEAGYQRGVLGQGAEAAEHAALRQRLQRQVKDDLAIGVSDAKTLAARPPGAVFATGWNLATAGQTAAGVALMRQALSRGMATGGDDARLQLATVLAQSGEAAQVGEARQMLTDLRDAGHRDGLSDLARLWLLQMASRP